MFVIKGKKKVLVNAKMKTKKSVCCLKKVTTHFLSKKQNQFYLANIFVNLAFSNNKRLLIFFPKEDFWTTLAKLS